MLNNVLSKSSSFLRRKLFPSSPCRHILIWILSIIWASPAFAQSSAAAINFGDNSSTWARDGECDDPRFAGEGMATPPLIDNDLLHDASDCRNLFTAGLIHLIQTSGASIDYGDNSSTWAHDDQCDDPRFAGRGMSHLLLDSDMFHDAQDCRELVEQGSIRILPGSSLVLGGRFERGSLREGDSTRNNGSYADNYTFVADRGDSAVIDLRSGDFDTYLVVRSPSGEEFSNDDFELSFDRSLISIPRTETGIYEVLVSSFMAAETGGYTVEISTDEFPLESLNQQISGVLLEEDNTFSSGESFDIYQIEGRPGQSISLELSSSDFDTYLILRQPNGEQLENDDSDNSDSYIETFLSELGTYEVFVTSFAAGEKGEYRLRIEEIIENQTQNNENQDIGNLQAGDTVNRRLDINDNRSSENRFEDSYYFNGNSGDTIIVDLSATTFDTYLSLQTPSGERIENDDHNGSINQSLLQLTLQESGRYRITVSSYNSAETGNYQISVRSAENINSAISEAAVGGGQIYGIFAGIADYPGLDSDLDRTDQDAIQARDALIEGAGMNPDNAYTLVNADATNSNFRSALNAINTDIDEDDTLVIFYSGHGGRVSRSTGPNSSDPDGFDETMELYDGPMLDDELASLLNGSSAGKILLVMDSCFSGGFAKDIISAPGRMGLFSSEEDVASEVAFKFQAGGYLSVFFDEAIREGYADRDKNGEITAIELSQYLHGRYRVDVKSLGNTSFVRTSGPQAAYQHLVVDRGGVGPYNVLFNRN